jgi:hypothetical protein
MEFTRAAVLFCANAALALESIEEVSQPLERRASSPRVVALVIALVNAHLGITLLTHLLAE